MERGFRGEAVTLIQAVYVDHGAEPVGHLGDRGDEDAASAANQEVAGFGAEAVVLDQGPVIGPDFKVSIAIGEDARAMAAAKGTGATTQGELLRRF